MRRMRPVLVIGVILALLGGGYAAALNTPAALLWLGSRQGTPERGSFSTRAGMNLNVNEALLEGMDPDTRHSYDVFRNLELEAEGSYDMNEQLLQVTKFKAAMPLVSVKGQLYMAPREMVLSLPQFLSCNVRLTPADLDRKQFQVFDQDNPHFGYLREVHSRILRQQIEGKKLIIQREGQYRNITISLQDEELLDYLTGFTNAYQEDPRFRASLLLYLNSLNSRGEKYSSVQMDELAYQVMDFVQQARQQLAASHATTAQVDITLGYRGVRLERTAYQARLDFAEGAQAFDMVFSLDNRVRPGAATIQPPDGQVKSIQQLTESDLMGLFAPDSDLEELLKMIDMPSTL